MNVIENFSLGEKKGRIRKIITCRFIKRGKKGEREETLENRQ